MLENRHLKYKSKGYEILYGKYKKLPKMSDAETERLHVYLRKGFDENFDENSFILHNKPATEMSS